MAKEKNNYYYVKNNSGRGVMAISHHVFETIVTNATKRIKGAKIYKGNPHSHSFRFYHPVECEIKRNGKIEVKVNISIKKGVDIKSTCRKVKEEIINDLLLAVETVSVNVIINVANIGE